MISTLEKRSPHLLDESTLQNFRASIRGVIITKDHTSYDEERSVYNGMMDRHIVKLFNA